MPRQKVLICGSGVSGSIVAFWLAKQDFDITVIERSKPAQKIGQGIEIEEPALKVVKMMGILDRLEQVKTGEAGFQFVDERSRPHGTFSVGDRLSPTGALEIMRGDLTEVLFHAADEAPNVHYRFSTTIKSLTQTSDQVTVELEERGAASCTREHFDLVIGADGIKSRTRQLALGSDDELGCLKPINIYISYFSIPKAPQDWPNSKLCNFPGRRVVWMRPIGEKSEETSVYLMHVKGNVPVLSKANASGDRLQQKQAYAQVYQGLGWETPRVLEGMMQTKNFYSDELKQVKLKSWSQGRVVVVGDAAWAPTPVTGEGNQLAIIGAWVLAQELARDPTPAAFEKYHQRFRSYVENAQNIPFDGKAPRYFCPETTWGIWVLRTVASMASLILRFLTWTRVLNLISKGDVHPPFDLEEDKKA